MAGYAQAVIPLKKLLAVNDALNKMKHLLFRYYGWIALVAFASAIGIAWINGAQTDWKVILGILSAALSFVYFVQKQKLEELKLFKELFKEFNERYDLLHDDLNGLLLDKTKKEITDPKFPSYPFEGMPRSQTPVVSCTPCHGACRIAAFRSLHIVGFLLLVRIILLDHHYTYFGAQ